MFISSIRPCNIYNNAISYAGNNVTRPAELNRDTVSFGNTKTDYGFKNLVAAVICEDTERVESIMASKDEETKKRMLLQTDEDGRDAIMQAVCNRDYQKAEVLLNAAKEINI